MYWFLIFIGCAGIFSYIALLVEDVPVAKEVTPIKSIADLIEWYNTRPWWWRAYNKISFYMCTLWRKLRNKKTPQEEFEEVIKYGGVYKFKGPDCWCEIRVTRKIESTDTDTQQ